uniref:Protein transport protein sec16 n=1 Tax=Apteryx owenii TaxID=8824 RepID=A0A8B9QAF0_APTOW
MDPWAPPWPPQPRERHAAPAEGWSRGPQRDPRHAPAPQPRRPALRAGPDAWDEYHRPRRDRGRDRHRPASRAEYYESAYANRPYSRWGQPVLWCMLCRSCWAAASLGKGRWTIWACFPEMKHFLPSSLCGPFAPVLPMAPLSPQPPTSGKPSLLLQYRESGLSSSSYELSQYICDSTDHYDPLPVGAWSPVQAASTPAPVAPQKFPLPHVPVCFGAGGQLVLVCPHFPAEGQPAHVELHSLEVILHDTKEQEELQAFPGPLAREDLHKVDVMTFCQHKIATSCDLSTQRGRDSALLWKLLVLLCRQNGSMVGSDTAELLMQDCKRLEKYKRQNPVANLINLSDDEWRAHGLGTVDLLTGEVPPIVETLAQTVEKFTKLLYYGRKKEALDWAMRNQLWGHALFLSSKMDPRTYSWVLTGFTNTLAANDPLQTLFQLMSGRVPQAAQCCGDAKWGDWRPHLAVMLSNKVGDAELNHRAIVTMGDTLAGRGLTEAAHFCYLMANIPFGYFGEKADRMALLGSSHR